MEENTYISDILSNLGLAINENNNNEIVINYHIIFYKKSMKFTIDSNYKITSQSIGSFLVDFLNTDFEEYNQFFNFFMKYSLALLEYDKLKKLFKDIYCSKHELEQFILSLQNRNKKTYIKLQEQIDMILDYCLSNQNDKYKNYKPIEKLYVLKIISPSLTILYDSKSMYFSTILFSDFPGKTEKEIYSFLSNKKNKIIEFNLILPYNLESILYKSICSILKENVYLKNCKNCGKYFIATNKASTYCSNIAPNELKKTCKDIGRKTAFKNSKNTDPILYSYYKVYNRKYMMKSRYPDIDKYDKDLNKYREIGKKKLKQYKENKLSAEDFEYWIKKNS